MTCNTTYKRVLTIQKQIQLSWYSLIVVETHQSFPLRKLALRFLFLPSHLLNISIKPLKNYVIYYTQKKKKVMLICKCRRKYEQQICAFSKLQFNYTLASFNLFFRSNKQSRRNRSQDKYTPNNSTKWWNNSWWSHHPNLRESSLNTMKFPITIINSSSTYKYCNMFRRN